MKILEAPLHCREGSVHEDNAVALAIRHATMFDKVMFSFPSRNECPRPLSKAVVQYALANAKYAGLGIIVLRHLWDYWTDEFSDANTPKKAAWYANAIGETYELARGISSTAETAMNFEPMCESPQLWLRDAWDESKRPAIDAAIQEAVMQVGRVHYGQPTSSLGPEKWTWSASGLCRARICWKTSRMVPTRDAGGGYVWEEPICNPPPGHCYRKDVRGMWVTSNPDGIDAKSGKRVLTVAEAATCPEDSEWHCSRGEVPEVVRILGELGRVDDG